ncbi:MAG: serine/threonine protein phosphatase, partial [Gammaproteobacteria bacterium]|nr:serine/threonine protein phosphatase [Gammaproteobacteria bacterium]
MNHRIDLALAQHRGLLTRAQQDALLVAGAVLQSSDLRTHPPVSEGQNGLCAVADGVAISPCPQRASRAVLEALYEIGPRHDDVLQDGWIGPRLIRRHVHPALCRALAGNRRTHGSACTLALLQWRAGRFSVLNVGDSRVYRIDREGRWQQLSRDHTYFNSMVERGEVAADQSVGQLYQDLEHMLIADEAEEDFAIHWR